MSKGDNRQWVFGVLIRASPWEALEQLGRWGEAGKEKIATGCQNWVPNRTRTAQEGISLESTGDAG